MSGNWIEELPIAWSPIMTSSNNAGVNDIWDMFKDVSREARNAAGHEPNLISGASTATYIMIPAGSAPAGATFTFTAPI